MAAYRNGPAYGCRAGPINYRRRSMHNCTETCKKQSIKMPHRTSYPGALGTRLKWALLGAALLAGTCHAANEAKQFSSSSPGVDVVYEVHPTADFRAFLGAQPPGSVSAIAMFEPPSRVAVVARIKLTGPAKPIGSALQFTTAFHLANGATVPQSWRIDNAQPGRLDYRAIFGLPQDVVSATTVVAR